jgi:hypothetical protein
MSGELVSFPQGARLCSECGGDHTLAVLQADVGKEAAMHGGYRWRREVFAAMEVGDAIEFEAPEVTDYAGVRGSAYHYALRREPRWRMRCRRVCDRYVEVVRVA